MGVASTEVSALQQEVNDLKQKCTILEDENKDLKIKASCLIFLLEM